MSQRRGRTPVATAALTPEARRNALIMQRLIAKSTQLAARLPRVLRDKSKNCAENCPLIPICMEIAELIDEFSSSPLMAPAEETSQQPSEAQEEGQGG